MSSEDLERYEAEIELALYTEYRDVISMFRFVVETERRFYLANKVERISGSVGSVHRIPAQRLLGLGHVSQEQVSCRGDGGQHTRDHRGGTTDARAVSAPPSRVRPSGRTGGGRLVRTRRVSPSSPGIGGSGRVNSTWCAPVARRWSLSR